MTTLIPKNDFMNGGTTPLGAVNRTISEKLQDSISVKDFGALGDGTNDDSTAFTNALAVNKGVTVPYGTYKLTSVVTVTEPPVIYGESLKSTLSNGLYINATGGYRGNIQNLKFVTNTNTGVAVETNDTHLTKFDSISATGFLNGAEFNYSFSNTLINCEFHENSTGAVFINNCNAFSAYSCHFTNNTNHGASVSSSQKMTFVGCDFSNNTNYGLVVDSADNGTLQALGIKVDSSYCEGNTTDFFVGAGSNAVKVEGCVFTNNAHFGSKQYGYFVNNALSTQIINPDFSAATFSGNAIYLATASQNTTIIPFISSQVTVQAGATVSTQTIQTGIFEVTLSGTGSTGAVNFPATYYQTPFVTLNIISDSAPAGSLGNIYIKNGVGVTGFFWEILAGISGSTVKVQWRAGN